MNEVPEGNQGGEKEPFASEQRVLILAPTGGDGQVARATLAAAGLTAQVCQGIEELCSGIAGGASAVLIAQEALTPPALDRVQTALAGQPPWSDLPVLILTRAGRFPSLGMQASPFSLGPLRLEALPNATVLERPLRKITLVRAVRSALASRCRQYEIRQYLHERQRAAAERVRLLETQRAFLRDVLASVTEGKLRLCDHHGDLPERLPCGASSVTLTPQSLRQLRRQVAEASDATAHCPKRQQDLILATHEAAMNTVTHAGGGSAFISHSSSGTVQVWIEDQGSGIDIEELPRATLERGFSSAGTLGHGFWLILKLADRVWLLTSASGTTIVIEQDRQPPEPSWLATDP